ncbi:uncharacterized protein LOC127288621 isoform X3 [Leptopilina boulardi]|uniref:uncharacterized protein LOC127288621 isoform X3 n=1 Tax=Leptopilina boulardi TaxID=63433 RepID=UPI0021F5F470|nr:uncharacterized protein LOC127288621 isoform X3 [Leptopilina boulardi]
MSITRLLGFYSPIITILSIFVHTYCQTTPSENSSSEGICFSSNDEVYVEMKTSGNFTLKWKKPNRTGLIIYQISPYKTYESGYCHYYSTSDDCPTYTLFNVIEDKYVQFFVRIFDGTPYSTLSSSRFNFTEIKDGCLLRGGLEVFNITVTSVILQWNKPKNCNYMFVNYTVLINHLRTFEKVYQEIPFPFNSTNFTVKNLLPRTVYEFTLVVHHFGAETSNIYSPHIRTKHHLDSKLDSYIRETGDVKLVNVLKVTNSSVTIEWTIPEISVAADMEIFIIDLDNTGEPELFESAFPFRLGHIFPDTFSLKSWYKEKTISNLKFQTNYIFLVAYTDEKGVIFLKSKKVFTLLTKADEFNELFHGYRFRLNY